MARKFDSPVSTRDGHRMQKNRFFPIDFIESETIFLIDYRRKLSIRTISAIDSGKQIGALKVDFDIPISRAVNANSKR